jgi:hypothetical protein
LQPLARLPLEGAPIEPADDRSLSKRLPPATRYRRRESASCTRRTCAATPPAPRVIA